MQRAFEKGKGVLALSAHLGSFTLIGARLAASGYPFSAVVKHPAQPTLCKLLDDYRRADRYSYDFCQTPSPSGARHSTRRCAKIVLF